MEERTAHDCAERIQRLRTELGLPEDYEFHFSQNSVSIRDAFLRALSPYPFSYYMSEIDRASRGLDTLGIRRNEDLSRFLIRQTFESALGILQGANVVVDGQKGELRMRNDLRTYLSREL